MKVAITGNKIFKQIWAYLGDYSFCNTEKMSRTMKKITNVAKKQLKKVYVFDISATSMTTSSASMKPETEANIHANCSHVL